MSKNNNRKRKNQSVDRDDNDIFQCLPVTCKATVRTHVNTVYVGSIIRIYDKSVGPEGHLVTAHWEINDRLFVTIHEQSVSKFINLKSQQWVVDHRAVKPGSIILASRCGTDDIKDDFKTKTSHEIRKRNSRILLNDTLMEFPTKSDRESYRCSLFCMTCNCGNSKRAVTYSCSQNITENAGKVYYGCPNKFTKSHDSCNFCVWKTEMQHEKYITCECGVLFKKDHISAKGMLPVYKFVCINRNNKYHEGCKVTYDDQS